MRLLIQPNYEKVSTWTANYIANKINTHVNDKPFVLGLPTGSTPIGTYKALIALHNKGILSFSNVVTFNMDEYIGIDQSHPESYHSYMWNNFFKHIDIKKEQVNMLNGDRKSVV